MVNLYKKLCLKLLLVGLLVGCSNDVNFSVPSTSQDFNQTLAYNNKVDFLFIMDNSDSMAKARVNLFNSLPGLVEALNKLKLDFRLASTSTTMASWFSMAGRLFGEPKYITSETPNFLAKLKERILIEGPPGSSIEKGLDSMLNVLSETYQNSEGQNFLRSDSLLVVVYVTNEDDGSDKINSSSKTDQTKYYSDFLNSLKPTWSNGERGWIFNFVGLTSLNEPCSTGSNGTKIPGIRLMELANKSKGRIESICQANLGFAVSNIKARIMQFLTDYKLNSIPNVDSIKVFINGAEIPKNDVNGWSYIANLNVVRFNGNAVPTADADIRIDFTPNAPN